MAGSSALQRSVAQAPIHRGRSPDSQVIATPAAFPLPKEQWLHAGRSLFTVARPCGIFTRFPFHPPLKASTSDSH